MTLKNNRSPLLWYFKLYASFLSHRWIQTGVTVRKHLNWGKSPENFIWQENCEKGDRWAWQTEVFLRVTWSQLTIGHLFYATSSIVHHIVAIDQLKMELVRKCQIQAKISDFFPAWISLTDDHRASLLTYFELYASFCGHLWNETGVTVWNGPVRVKIGNFLSRMTLK